MKRDNILSEIRRTAAANGGVPLGRQRFLQETGIKEADWSGKLWARWSDAVREAGFEPNELQGAYADDFVLERYAKLALELNRTPTVSELKLRSRQDPTFPSHNTFSRFGSKAQLLGRVFTFCAGREALEPVALLCAPYATAAEETAEPAESESEVFGFVYLIKSGGHYKIGRTNALGRRERELAIQLPERAKTVHAIRTDDPSGIEAYWHRRFESKRKNGEWFALSAQDVSAFRRRKFM